MSDRSECRLRTALRANAAFSAVSAAILLGLSSPLAGALGAPRSVLLGIGAALALFVVDLLATAHKRPIPSWKVRAFVAMDSLWVLGSVAVVLLPTPLTTLGRAAVLAVAVVVAALAVQQHRGLRKAAGASTDDAPAPASS